MVEVSIIIPSYNHAHFLDDCLGSVFRQSGVDLEVLLVDDGSTDDTREVAAKYAGDITYLYQANGGLSAARNTGLKHSRGKYVQFLDADDMLAEGCLRAKCDAMRRVDDRTILVCRNRLFREVSRSGQAKTKGRWGLYTTNLDLHMCRLNIAPPHAYFIRRSMVDLIGNFDESYGGCEDYDFWLRALGAGYSFVYVPDAEVYYRQSIDSMAHLKARDGAFPFDVLVHQRKYLGDYGVGVNDILASPEGKLALVDGMLRTAARIDPKANNEGRELLLHQVRDCLGRPLRSEFRDSSFETRLYLRRIAQVYLTQFPEMEDKELRQLLDSLVRRFKPIKDCARDLRAVFPFDAYEKQLLTYATLDLMMTRR